MTWRKKLFDYGIGNFSNYFYPEETYIAAGKVDTPQAVCAHTGE